MKPAYWIVFDVESIGLHGEAFAFGAVVMDANGKIVDCREVACVRGRAKGDTTDRAWCDNHIPAMVAAVNNPVDLRYFFWQFWMEWKERGAALAADCAWPVEARFLNKCVEDDPARNWQGPYPLVDIGSVMIGVGMDPLAKYPRLPNELPEHSPLADARQSARLLMECLAEADRLAVKRAMKGSP